MKFKRFVGGILSAIMIISIFASIPISAEETTEDGLLMYLNFDNENTDTSMGKAVAEGGTLVYTDGVSGKAAKFINDGTYLKLTKADDSSLLANTDEFTVSFWSNTDAKSWYFFTAPNDNAQVYPKEQYVGILDNVSSILSERYDNSLNTASARPSGNDVTASVSGGAWKHIAVVESIDSMKIYVNGELKKRSLHQLIYPICLAVRRLHI